MTAHGQPWGISWDAEAGKELARLDRRTQERIVEAVERLAATERGDVKRLRVSEELRLRVGPWRVRYVLRRDTHTIRVLRVFPRGDGYRD